MFLQWVLSHEIAHAIDLDLLERSKSQWSQISIKKNTKLKQCLKENNAKEGVHKISEDYADFWGTESMIMALENPEEANALEKQQFFQAILGNVCSMPDISVGVHSSGDYRARSFLFHPDFDKRYPDRIKGQSHKIKNYCGDGFIKRRKKI